MKVGIRCYYEKFFMKDDLEILEIDAAFLESVAIATVEGNNDLSRL